MSLLLLLTGTSAAGSLTFAGRAAASPVSLGGLTFAGATAPPVFTPYTSHGHGIVTVVKSSVVVAVNRTVTRRLLVTSGFATSAVPAANGQGKAAAR